MSLKTLADSLAKTTLQKFDSFRETITYLKYTGTGVYTVATDSLVRPSTTYIFPVVFTGYAETEQGPSYSATASYTGDDILLQKAKIIFARLDVTDSFDPETDDTFTRPNGEIWKVFKAENPPGASVFTLEVHRVR